MQPEHSDAAAVATKLAVLWSAVATSFTTIPWSHIAAALAAVYSVHLIVGWWIDRIFGPRQPRQPRQRPSGRRSDGGSP